MTDFGPQWETGCMALTRALLLVVMATVRTGTPRDFDAMERRRKRAGAALRQGQDTGGCRSRARGVAPECEPVARRLAGGRRPSSERCRTGRTAAPARRRPTCDVWSGGSRRVRSKTATPPTCGRSSAWPRSSRPRPGSPTTLVMSGASCVRWAGAANVRRAGPSSATTRPSQRGSSTTGPG